MKISREDFDLWLANPVTEAVRAACELNAEANKQAWIAKSWDAEQCDPIELARLKAFATIAIDLANLEFDDLPEEMRDDESERDLSRRVQSARSTD